MRVTITNTSKAPQGVHTVRNVTYIRAGATATLDVTEESLARIRKLPFFKVADESAEAEAAPAAPEASPADAFDAMSDDELRAFIEARDDRKPHPATGREKLLAKARGED